ncbi:lipopolysaccharide 1,2-glucosyltransferase [Providencia rettgeri]|nr:MULTISPECIES: glycosyltransferase [Providencia]HCI97805.1 lipopolysaccharide 1,2-glucosyltransferase [Providencia sp.]APC14052.1 General stress protein A [Providencia rettgeri]AVL73339.1 lipopolysaccharide 1,2-glucosyltransferase [Providencia rettgeri]EJD6613914.1 lipopolysaccharide 1,2-glucosyltransferase [Providencia rettgeri]EJD6673260.1 lipopolysaccharide 1,2-glucosyltransferase [Providencia rettgeri]
MLCNEMIKSKIEINSDTNISNECYFHISYGVDENFLYGVGTSISSILLNNQENFFHFHLFVDNLSDERLFHQLMEHTQHRLSIYLIDNEKFKSLPLPSKGWSSAIYFRLIIISYLATKGLDKLLYLDADIICKGELSYLGSLEFNESTYLYAVKDKFRSDKNSLPMDMSKYFNSGFLYMSIKRMAEYNIPNQVIDLVNKSDFTHPDQDALNILLNNKVINISENFNFMFSLDWHITKKSDLPKISEQVVFIHFVGLTKPFHEWAKFYSECIYFESARDNSPWKNVPLLKPEGYKQLSRKKSHLRRNGDYIGFLITTIKYLMRKLSI